MVVDKLIRLTEFVSSQTVTSIVAVRSVVCWSVGQDRRDFRRDYDTMGWCSKLCELRHGRSAADNGTMGLETEEHHPALLPVGAWGGNGSVEVVGKDLLWSLRALLCTGVTGDCQHGRI